MQQILKKKKKPLECKVDFFGKRIVEMDGVREHLWDKNNEKGTAQNRCYSNDEVKEKGNLGFVVFNSRTIGCEKIQFFNSCSCNKTQQGMAEFVHDRTGQEKSLDHPGVSILCPQPESRKTEENNQYKSYR